MKRLKALAWTLALATFLVATGLYLNTKEVTMPGKVMMYYGGFEVEEMFDASRWFSSGMYKPRHMDADKGASNVSMLRIKPMPFTRMQLEDLPFVVAGAFDYGPYEDVNTEPVFIDPPDLSKRIRYIYSAFAEPNKPVDYYNVFVTLHGQRYVITFARDGQTGDALLGGSAERIFDGQPSHAEHLKIFAEIENAERKSH
ncbi:hypothetical protein [Pseudomonas oryzae]|nr:hypothetical protein [Pseudomonas oryzae]